MALGLKIGELSYRIVLQSKEVTRDASGGELIKWRQELLTWAAAAPLSGNELLAAQQRHPESAMRFTARYRADVFKGWRIGWRLKWEGLAYNILNVADVNGEHYAMQLDCTAGLRS